MRAQPARRHTEGENLPVAHMERGGARDRAAIDRRGGGGSGEGHPKRAVGPDPQPPEGDLEGGQALLPHSPHFSGNTPSTGHLQLAIAGWG